MICLKLGKEDCSNKQMKELLLGIDIGIKKNTGFAVYEPATKKFLEIRSMDMFDGMELVKAYHADPSCKIVVYVENSNMSSNVYGADENFMAYLRKWMGKKFPDFPAILKKIRSTIMWGQNVGKNKGAAITFCDKLRNLEIPIIEINPSDRRVAGSTHSIGKITTVIPITQLNMPTKCSEMQFQKYTGCMIKCDEHGMDAATMPYGMTFWVSTNHARGQAKNIIEKAKQK